MLTSSSNSTEDSSIVNKKTKAASIAKKKEAVLAIYGDEDLHSEPLLQSRVSLFTEQVTLLRKFLRLALSLVREGKKSNKIRED